MRRHCTDAGIHIDESLPDDRIHAPEREPGRRDGVYSACVNDQARHLMLVEL